MIWQTKVELRWRGVTAKCNARWLLPSALLHSLSAQAAGKVGAERTLMTLADKLKRVLNLVNFRKRMAAVGCSARWQRQPAKKPVYPFPQVG